MKKSFLLCIITILSLLFLSSISFSVEVKKTYEKTFRIDPGGHITVNGDEGFIKVDSWDKPEVHLKWTKQVWGKNKKQAEELLDQIEIRINHTGNRLYVKIIEPRHNRNFSFWDIFDPDTWSNHNFRSPVVDFELTVPREINLSFSNDEGDVTVNSIIGDVDIEVDEGDIEISDVIFDDIQLFADEGDITGINLKNESGTITMEVDEGEITLDDVVTRRLRLNCDEGDATFNNFSCGSCNISTDEGDIELDILLQKNCRYQINTDEGNVYFYLPDNPDVRFDLETEEGSIRTDFDLKIKKRDDGQRCHDSLRNGSSLIKANTDEGYITVRKR